MKKALCLIALSLIPLAASSSHAADGRAYLGGQVGMFLPIRSSVSGAYLPADSRLMYDPGLALAAVGGYQFGNGLRGEGELNYRHLTTDKLDVGGEINPVHGDLSTYGLMANIYYDFRNRTVVTPYLGAGVGVVMARFGNGTSNGSAVWSSDDDVAVAYQGIGGFALRLSDHTALDFAYRHYAVPRLHFQTLSAQFRGPTLSVGIQHWF